MGRYDTFDLITYMDERGHDYMESGPNISPMCIGVPCPFCQGKGYHRGVFKSSKHSSCWQCGEKVGLPALIKQLENCSWERVYELIRKYSSPGSYIPKEVQQTGKQVVWPEDMRPGLNKRAEEYLRGRNFNPDLLTKKYDLRHTGPVGEASFRIIVPIVKRGVIVAWTGADYTRKSEEKYLNAHSRDSIIPGKSCLYNFDNVKTDFCMLVEGITDCWRMGDGAVAALGKALTEEQIEDLNEIGVKKVAIVLDDDAYEMAEHFADQISTFAKVKVVYLEDGDPAEFTDREAMQLRMDLKNGKWT